MKNNTSLPGDVLRVVQAMGVDHPTLVSACAALGYDIKFWLKEINVDEADTAKCGEGRLLAIEQRVQPPVIKKRWAFTFTVLNDYQKSDLKDASFSEKPIPQVDFNQRKKARYSSVSLAPAIDERQQWKSIAGLLGRCYPSTAIDVKQLSKHLAQYQPLLQLPLQSRYRMHHEIWLYVDYSEDNFPLYRDFTAFKQQLKRHCGVNDVARMIDITGTDQNVGWRDDFAGLKHASISHSAIPLPDHSPQVILLADPQRFAERRLRHWLTRLEQSASSTLKLSIRSAAGWYNWDHAAESGISLEDDQRALQKVLAVLSTTPARMTWAMVRALRQRLTGGTLAVEVEVHKHPDMRWELGRNEGYWGCPDEASRTFFKDQSDDFQITAANIVREHLPKQIDSLIHEHQLIVAALSPAWKSNTSVEQASATQYFEGYMHYLRSTSDSSDTGPHLAHFYRLRNRMGEGGELMPEELKRAITVAEYKIRRCWPDLKLGKVLQSDSYQALKRQETDLFSSGAIVQQKGQWSVMNSAEVQSLTAGVPIVQLADSQVNLEGHEYKPGDSISRHDELFLNQPHRYEGITAAERFTLETFSSDDIYWATSVSVSRKGVVAETNAVRVFWPANQHKTGCEIELLPGAPEWLYRFPPQLDEYGLFCDIQVKDLSFRLRYIPPGSFLMGSPDSEIGRDDDELQHPVTLTQGFWLGETTVTQAFWALVMGENPSHFKEGEGEILPVDSVSWDACQQFFKTLSNILPELSLHCPTEAQWEYACRAGTQTPFSCGGLLDTTDANYDGNHPYAGGEEGEDRARTVSPQSFKPNHWGLYQMHGNLWEWCADGRRQYTPEAVVDPVGSTEGYFALRGGSWFSHARRCRSAYRADDPQGRLSQYVGLRVAQAEHAR